MMSFKDLFVLFIFVLVVIPSHGAESSAELYWKLKLGNITMPKALKPASELDPTDFQVNQDGRRERLYNWGGDPEGIYNFGEYGDKIKGVSEFSTPQDGRVLYFPQDRLSTPGSKIKFSFIRVNDVDKFLPLPIAKAIEIASNKLQWILNTLSINPKSKAGIYIEKMLRICKNKGIKDEVRHCSYSVEDMVDFIASSFNSEKDKYMVVSTEEEQKTVMEYKFLRAKKIGQDDKHTMVCHKLNNPFVVFLCHNVKHTDVYDVALENANGKQVNAVAVCHTDTSNMNRGHIAFKILKFEPGTKPICHFLSGNTIIWLQK